MTEASNPKQRNPMRQRLLTALLILVAAVWMLPLHAAFAEGGDDTRWVWRTIRQQYRSCDTWTGHCYLAWRYVRVRRQNHVYHLPEQHPTRVHAYERRRDDDDRRHERGPQCVTTVVDVVSTEHTQEEHARDAARKLWMSKTQWQWGGQYMNLEEASEVRWRCGPSNAHDTFSAKIAENVGKLVGRDGQNVRCQLWALPCRAKREADTSRDRKRER